jgi:hypothetical protein
MQIRYYGDKISKRIAKTPEGFLICQDVPISRTGYQEYLASEIMDNPVNGHKIIPVYRPAEEVFDFRSLASFEGKPVTNEHPDEDVTPDNYTNYACGHVQNVHPGEGKDSNKVLADLYITDPSLINSILNGKREISCGYYAEEKRDASGKLCQTKIRGNHVAVVNSGRAGSKVCIRDRKPVIDSDFYDNNLFDKEFDMYDEDIYEDADDMLDDDEVYVEDLIDDDEDLIQDYGVKGMKHTGGFQKGNPYRFGAGNPYRFQKRGDDDEEMLDDDDIDSIEDDDELVTDYSEDELFEDDDMDQFDDDDLEAIEDDDLDSLEDDDEILDDDDMDFADDDDEFMDDDDMLEDDDDLVLDYGVKGMKKGQHVMEGKHVKEEPKKGLSRGQKAAIGLGAGAALAAGIGLGRLSKNPAAMAKISGAAGKVGGKALRGAMNAEHYAGKAASAVGRGAKTLGGHVASGAKTLGGHVASGASRAKNFAVNQAYRAKQGVVNTANRAYGHAENAFTKAKNFAGEKARGFKNRFQNSDPSSGALFDDDIMFNNGLEDCGMYDDDELMDACGGYTDEDLFEDDDFDAVEDDGDEMINDYSEEELFEDDDDEMLDDDEDEIIGDDDDIDAIEDDNDEMINDYSEDELFEDSDDELEDDDDEMLDDDDDEMINDYSEDELFEDDDDELDSVVSDDDDELMDDDDEEMLDDDDEVIEDDDDPEVMPTDEVEQKMSQGSTLDTRKDAALREIVSATRGISNAQERKSVQDAIYKAFCGKSQMGDIMRTIEKNTRSRQDSMRTVKTQMSAAGQQAIYDSFNPHKQSGK